MSEEIKYILIYKESFSGPYSTEHMVRFNNKNDLELWLKDNSSWVSTIEIYETKLWKHEE